MIKAVVFDLDDTLYPERQFVLSGFAAVDGWLSDHHGRTAFYQTAARLFASGRRGDIFDLALEQLGVEREKGLVQELVRVYREHRPALEPFQDALAVLQRLRGAKKLAVITDGYLAVQRSKMAALGIAHYFDAICYSDEGGRECWKPSAVPYRRIMDELCCAGEDCLYVADNPSKDFITARALGWGTVQIRRPDGEYAQLVPAPGYQADSSISTLYELEDLV
ncbi:HAD family hydrolase [Geomonas sp.]|uniref:HAD family hydrolase n=1 Tax=Geomonas sp. TaxID=2651584 RepID=UPI002B46D600|nr:HAD family hydrolase [Geomonas sp.]HJV35987.1 HAD family hydrolase [Geomonas sp.]